MTLPLVVLWVCDDVCYIQTDARGRETHTGAESVYSRAMRTHTGGEGARLCTSGDVVCVCLWRTLVVQTNADHLDGAGDVSEELHNICMCCLVWQAPHSHHDNA